MDREALRNTVAEALGEPAASLRPDEDLVRRGLDSVRLMRLAARLRHEGVRLAFADLVERPTLNAWWERLARQETGPATEQQSPDEDPDASGPFSLAPMQHAYWIGRGEGRPLGGVGAHFYNEFDGHGVDPDRLERAVRMLMARHPMLRARFSDDGTQQITEGNWPGLTVHDLRGTGTDGRERRLAELREELAHRKLDVAAGQVFDIQLSLLPDGVTRTHVSIDMLVADAQSFRVLLADLTACYQDPEDVPAPAAYTFRQYLAAQRRARGADRDTYARDRAYWQERLSELPGPAELPLAADPGELTATRVTRRHLRLDQEQWDLLADRAREHGLTLAMVFAAAYAEVLGAWSARPRFLLNLPLYDREPLHADVDRIAGDFTSLVLLPVDVGDEKPFAEHAVRLQEEFRRCAAHASYSGLEVLRDLARRDPDRQAGAPTVFTSALSLGELFGPATREVFGQPVWTISQTPQVWLDHQVTEREGGIFVNWDAVDGLLAEGVLDAMFDAYRGLLERLLAPDADWRALTGVPLPEEQERTRSAANATDGPSEPRTLHERFFARAAEHPEATALCWGEDGALGYGELADRSLRIAAALRDRGVRPGEPVAISVPKGPEQAEAVLGVLAAGGVYVPVGPEQPERRRARIHRSAGVRLVLAESVAAALDDGTALLTLESACASAPLEAPVLPWPESPAYVLHTSGSTGEPKGVVVPHRAAVNTLDDLTGRFALGQDDRVLGVSALDFDLSVFDLFAPLSTGGALVLPGRESARDAEEWVRLVRRHRVTVWQSVPVLMDMLLTATEVDGGTLPLRVALLGGDRVAPELGPRMSRCCPDGRLFGLGGTTETAIHSTLQEATHPSPDWSSVPYGVPLRNQRMRVTDEQGRDRPDHVPGELWIGGDSVALEYRGDPVRTAERFVQYQGERWYRTGDLARYRPDGTVEFLGRTDQQLKVRGHRIEPGEVESALAAHPRVRAAAVTTTGEGTHRRLAAVVAGPGLDPQELRDHAADLLPPAMVPATVTVLDALPLSANGKIDRRAVQEAAAAGTPRQKPGTLPRGPVEEAVADVWRALLGVDRVHREDDFFLLGGDSLLATRMVAGLRSVGMPGAGLRLLFDAPVLADFAARLGDGRPDDTAARPTEVSPDPDHRYEPFPATEVQLAYWLGRTGDFALGGTGTTWYTEFDGDAVDLDRLERAFNRLIARHEMLRALFDVDGRQRILPDVPPFRISVATPEPAHQETALKALREEMSHLVLDSSRWPLFDLRAVSYGEGRTRIGLTLDYLVFDALSIMTVFEELGALYRDSEAELPPVRLSFRDYVLGVHPDPRRLEEARRYWHSRVPELPPAPQLPLGTDPACVQSVRFVRREHRLPAERWARLVRRAREHQLTPSAVLGCAYAEALSAWSGQSRLSMVLTLFDRAEVHPDIDRVLGDFTSLLLVDHTRAGSWEESARTYQRRLWSALEHREISAVEVLREVARRGGEAQATVPVVFTSTLGVADSRIDHRMPFGRRTYGLSRTPQVLLDHQVSEHEGALFLHWDAAEELFRPGVLDALCDAQLRLLDWLSAEDTDWDTPVPELLPAAQRRRRDAVNATGSELSGATLHAPFFARAAAEPDRTALCWGEDGTMCYGQLADRALRVASALHTRGASPGSTVAVTLPKGPDQIAAVLGVLAAGCTYVPVGVDQPPLRAARVRESAGARLLLTDGLHEAGQAGEEIITLAEALAATPRAEPCTPDDGTLAYVIYTSGSTGEPKGVEITHRAAVNTVEDIGSRYGVGPDDRVLAVSALDFDLSVYDIFGLLGAGGALVLPDEDERRDAAAWFRLVERHGVTLWNSVPALLDMLLTAAGHRPLPGSLRLALVSGDWVPAELPARLADAGRGRCRLVALGGATEAAIWSNAYEAPDDGLVPSGWTALPYGRPLRNQRYRVVDESGRDCPEWVTGELWIGGAGVAAGYRGDPRRTADRFVTHDGRRWYRTGDLGRYWPDGTLEFIGRADQQVKIRGHRIELGEIEAALGSHPQVRVAVAAADGGRRLLAAFVPHAGEPPAETELRDHLADRIPAHMIPDRLMPLAELPLSANGKVDRAAVVRVAGRTDPAGGDEQPSGPLEQEIAGLWAALLERESVGRSERFLSVGGDSLLATRLLAALEERFAVRLSLRQLLTASTVAEQAQIVAERPDCARSGRPMGEAQDMEEGVL
ncbi:non-ribosomal peptide synthetase [Streptomyces sp. MspMP-M5]|nr:non-ribosomal peptide synthetase [Streptomyces sp. SID8354]